MEIRRYKPGEEGAVWEVVFAATRESNARDYHTDLIDLWAPHDQDMGQWADRLAQKNPFVAIMNEQIVGTAEIEAHGFIDYFYVHPNERRSVASACSLVRDSDKLCVVHAGPQAWVRTEGDHS